jgi:hypothetical protein
MESVNRQRGRIVRDGVYGWSFRGKFTPISCGQGDALRRVPIQLKVNVGRDQ